MQDFIWQFLLEVISLTNKHYTKNKIFFYMFNLYFKINISYINLACLTINRILILNLNLMDFKIKFIVLLKFFFFLNKFYYSEYY